jgi:hypothetical protein
MANRRKLMPDVAPAAPFANNERSTRPIRLPRRTAEERGQRGVAALGIASLVVLACGLTALDWVTGSET